MTQINYNNVGVTINDPQERWMENEEFAVTVRFDSHTNKFEITIPEMKPKAVRAEKPKPVDLYTGPLFGIHATRRGDNKPQVSWIGNRHDVDMTLGQKAFLAELKSAGQKAWEAYV